MSNFYCLPGKAGGSPGYASAQRFCVLTILPPVTALAVGLPAQRAIAQRFRALCRFSDAGMTRLSTHCGDRRPKSAKARNRGKWGTGGAAGAMESGTLI